MHFPNMLRDIRLLREGFIAVGVVALERSIFRVRAHVVHELRRVRYDLVTQAAELALEQFEVARIFLEALEDEHSIIGALRDLLPVCSQVT